MESGEEEADEDGDVRERGRIGRAAEGMRGVVTLALPASPPFLLAPLPCLPLTSPLLLLVVDSAMVW